MTTRFDLQTMAEFAVAVEVLGVRSINAMVHQMVTQKIREAKDSISAEEFEERVARQKKETMKRSKKKAKEYLEMIGELRLDGGEKKENKED